MHGYRVGEGADLDRVVARLAESFELSRERSVLTTTYYDTFDWRLWRRGETLEVEATGEGSRALWRRRGGAVVRAPLTGELGMADSLPAGEMRRSLGKVIAMRRLLPVVELRREGSLLRLLDRRRKTVVRLAAETRKARRPGSRGRFEPLESRVEVRPVKGYDSDARRVAAWLDARPDLSAAEAHELEEAAGAIGRHPGGYGDKLAVKLSPELAADRAVRKVLRTLLATARANEAGVIEDLDSEFLHDFRVAVRRTRSALGQVKGVFDAGRLKPLRKELSWLGKVTGPTRDLDVYLLKLPGYAARLPKKIRGDLAPLAEHLRELHAKEQAALAAALRSTRYRRLVRRWTVFLEGPADEAERTERGRQPVLRVARKSIARAHRRVLSRSAGIDDDSPASDLHRLRIDCKKLRYLLEFFRSLFDAREIRRVIRSLKELQDNLGDFNDYGVQQGMLRRLASELDDKSGRSAAALLAIGRLLADLEADEARERRRFAEISARFSSPKTTRRFRKMLDAGGGA